MKTFAMLPWNRYGHGVRSPATYQAAAKSAESIVLKARTRSFSSSFGEIDLRGND